MRAGPGSEAGSGWAFVRSAAEVAEVILLTAPGEKEDVEAEVASKRLTVEVFSIDVRGNKEAGIGVN